MILVWIAVVLVATYALVVTIDVFMSALILVLGGREHDPLQEAADEDYARRTRGRT